MKLPTKFFRPFFQSTNVLCNEIMHSECDSCSGFTSELADKLCRDICQNFAEDFLKDFSEDFPPTTAFSFSSWDHRLSLNSKMVVVSFLMEFAFPPEEAPTASFLA